MQEQLKAHQLEELVHLQEEQQRLLGMVHVAQQDGADTENTLTLCYCHVIVVIPVVLLSNLDGAGSTSLSLTPLI